MSIKGEYQFPKTGRYFSTKTITGQEKEIWIVLHGYRQLAEHFIRKFGSDVSESINIIAPEGMHRFYIDGYSGKVGASWMTKVEREIDISDYVNALDLFLSDILLKFDNRPKINILGFSQGASTAVRWTCCSIHKINRLVLWAGSFPKDIDFDESLLKLNSINLEIVIGDDDEFIKEPDIKKLGEMLDTNSVNYRLTMFKGNHDIKLEVFKELMLG